MRTQYEHPTDARLSPAKWKRWLQTLPPGTCTTPERFVLHILVDHVNREGLSWPGRTTISSETGMDRSHVKSALRGLTTKGLITVHEASPGGRGNRTVYRLLEGGNGVSHTPFSPPRNGVRIPEKRGILAPINGVSTRVRNGTLREQRGTALTHTREAETTDAQTDEPATAALSDTATNNDVAMTPEAQSKRLADQYSDRIKAKNIPSTWVEDMVAKGFEKIEPHKLTAIRIKDWFLGCLDKEPARARERQTNVVEVIGPTPEEEAATEARANALDVRAQTTLGCSGSEATAHGWKVYFEARHGPVTLPKAAATIGLTEDQIPALVEFFTRHLEITDGKVARKEPSTTPARRRAR